MLCCYCGKSQRVSSNVFPVGSLYFCSESCLKKHVRQQPALCAEDVTMLRLKGAPQSWGDRNCYSIYLGVCFRSWFECAVAEHIVRQWNTQIFYEPHSIAIDDSHSYVPDFWIPQYGVWLEVKGEWLSGAKTKFSHALRILGKNRLILIPDMYKKWFVKKRKESCLSVS